VGDGNWLVGDAHPTRDKIEIQIRIRIKSKSKIEIHHRNWMTSWKLLHKLMKAAWTNEGGSRSGAHQAGEPRLPNRA
jgi:hypothetical protein